MVIFPIGPLFCSDAEWFLAKGDYAHKDLLWDQERAFSYLDRSRHLLVPRHADEVHEDEKLLLPLSVYGFVLRNRKWGNNVTFPPRKVVANNQRSFTES